MVTPNEPTLHLLAPTCPRRSPDSAIPENGGVIVREMPTQENIKKVALYVRVSTGRQTTENQKLILEKHALRMDWNYVIYEEQESTRKTRPVKQELMTKLREGVYDAVCVLKLDRWGRSLAELALEIKELVDKRVCFISLRDNIDLSTATGQLQFHIICAFAEFERELIRERTLDGIARAKADGKHCGRPPGAKDKKKRRKSGYHLFHALPETRKKYEKIGHETWERTRGKQKSEGGFDESKHKV